MVDHPCQGGVAHRSPCCSHLEGQVGVFVVGGRELGGEALDVDPQLTGNRQGGAADVVDLAAVAVARIGRIAVTAVIPGLAIAPHDAAGLLQAPLGRHQLGTHQAGAGPVLKGPEQFIEPPGTGFGVVVEQHHIGAPRHRGPAAARLVEAPGVLVPHHTHAGGLLGQGLAAAISGAVVRHDHLEGHPGGGVGQGGEAAPRDRVLVVHRNHDRGQGLLAQGQLQGHPWHRGAIGSGLLAFGQGLGPRGAIAAQGMAHQPLPQRQLRR